MQRTRSLTGWTWILALALPWPAVGAVFHVTTTTDTLNAGCDADCSLREAVIAANAQPGADVIMVGAGEYTLTRAGANENQAHTGDLDVNGDLTVVGAGAPATVIDGGGLDRVFHADHFSLDLFGVTVRNGKVNGAGGGILADGLFKLGQSVVRDNTASEFGGGVSASGGSGFTGSGAIVIDASTITGNRAGNSAGGLWIGGQAVLANSTVSGNQAGFFGGGLVLLEGFATVSSLTITGNSAKSAGGGLFLFDQGDYPSGGEPPVPIGLGIRNSILAGNTAPAGPDCFASLVSDGSNLIGIDDGCQLLGDIAGNLLGTLQHPLDAHLGTLGYHGGPTPTHPLLTGSPAIDSGAAVVNGTYAADCHSVDQRGEPRPADGDGDGSASCDIGAVEQSATCLAGEHELCLGGRFRVTANWETEAGAGPAYALPATADTGYFWFFEPANVELTIKVLDGCALNQRYWVFATGLTNVGVEITVADTVSGESYVHRNPRGSVFQPDLATSALEVCP